MNKLLVWLIGLLGPLWQSLGASPTAVKLIVATKLKVSDRTTHMTSSGTKAKKKGKWAEYFSYLLLLFIGGIFLVAIVRLEHLPSALGIGYLIISLYLAMLLVMELSESIFDTRDVSVLLSRPISDFTFALSRGLYVLTYSAKMMLAMCLIPFVYLAIYHPWQLLPFVLASAALTVMVTVGILSFYQFLLRKLSPDRFKKLLGSIQMLFSGFFIALYLAPQLSGEMDDSIADFRIVGEIYGFMFPTFWVAAWHDLGSTVTNYSYAQAVLGVLVFAIAGYVYRSQASGYGRSLLQLGSSDAQPVPAETVIQGSQGAAGKSGLDAIRDRLASLLTSPGLERASYNFHWAMMLRERSFKAKVYPTLLFAPLFVIFFMFRDTFGAGGDGFSSNLLFGLYYITMTIITPLGQARVTAEPAAAWVWSAHPLPDRGPVAYGQYMASLSQFYLPTFLITLPLFLYQGGIDFLPDIFLAMGVSIVSGAIYQYVERNLPFSFASDGNRMGSIWALVGVMIFAGLAGLGHYLLRMIPFGIWVGLVGAWVLAFVSLWSLRRVSGRYN